MSTAGPMADCVAAGTPGKGRCCQHCSASNTQRKVSLLCYNKPCCPVRRAQCLMPMRWWGSSACPATCATSCHRQERWAGSAVRTLERSAPLMRSSGMQAILRARGRRQRPQGWRRCGRPPSVNEHPMAAGNAATPLATARELPSRTARSPGGYSTWRIAGPAASVAVQARKACAAPAHRRACGASRARERGAQLSPPSRQHMPGREQQAGRAPAIAGSTSQRPACLRLPLYGGLALLPLGVGLGRTGRAGGRSRSPPGTSRCGGGWPGSTARPARAAARPARPRPRLRSPTARAGRARVRGAQKPPRQPRVGRQLLRFARGCTRR